MTSNDQTLPRATSTIDPESQVTNISIQNPTPEEVTAIAASISESLGEGVSPQLTEFKFKKSKNTDTKEVSFRNAVELVVPYPSVSGLSAIIEAGGKQLELLQEAAETVINDAVRNALYADQHCSAWSLPLDKLTWAAIANLPKAARKGGGIPKDVWEAFIADYIAVMPAATNKPIATIQNAVKLYNSRLQACKTRKPVLHFIVGELAIYMENSENVADFTDCVEMLLDKADTFLNYSDEDLLANL